MTTRYLFGGLEMLTTGNQLKAARALVGMDQETAAKGADLNVNTVRNMEAAGAGPIAGRAQNVQAVQRVLEAAGIEFLNHGQPGVRMRRLAVGDRVQCRPGVKPPEGLKLGPDEIGIVSLVEIDESRANYRISIDFPRTKWPGAPASAFQLVAG
jgi:hypothetical protein